MTDIAPQRINIQQEETRYKASNSEALLSRVGSAINLINLRQYDSRGFFLNGPYSIIGAQQGVDGAWGILFDVELIAVHMFNLVAGSSGNTTLDVRRFTASNTPAGGASIFSTKPTLSSAAGNNAYLFKDMLNGVDVQAPTGATMPVFDNGGGPFLLNRGDMLTINKDSSQVGGQNCGLVLYYRPR